MQRNWINLELTKTGRRGLDIWLRNRNELIPICHMAYEEIVPYVDENAERIMTYEDPVLVRDFPKKINDYFNGESSLTIKSFFRVYFDDVISEGLQRVLEEEGIETEPIKKCQIKIRFRKAFDSEITNQIKI